MLIFDYASALERQCEIALKSFSGERAADSQRLFAEICKRLTKDFLPPVDREDIAALSYELLKIGMECKKYFDSLKGRMPDDGIKKQLEFLPIIINGILGKKKTCGDDIRRLMDMNLKSAETANGNAANLNCVLDDFIKTANSAFFKNL